MWHMRTRQWEVLVGSLHHAHPTALALGGKPGEKRLLCRSTTGKLCSQREDELDIALLARVDGALAARDAAELLLPHVQPPRKGLSDDNLFARLGAIQF